MNVLRWKTNESSIMLRKIFRTLQEWYRKTSRILAAAAYGFWADDCYTKASTLTFYTLQSIVPFLAAALGIASGFGFGDYLQQLITETFSEQKEVLNYALEYARSMLTHISGGVVVGFGVVLLLWTNINLIGYIELTLNSIWKIRTPRALYQKIKDYLATIVLLPTVFVASSGLTVYFKGTLASLQAYPMLETVSVYMLMLFKLLPMVLSVLLFFFLYLLIPNTAVRVWPRLIAAVIAGAAFQLWQVIYIDFQMQIFNYNVVYGTFALLPLFIIWLQFSWLIALAGAEIAAHIENDIIIDSISSDKSVRTINRKQLALLILYNCLKTFYTRSTPQSDLQLAKELKVPVNAVQNLLEILDKKGILSAVHSSTEETCYLPSSDPGTYTIKDITDSIDINNDNEFTVESSEPLSRISRFLSELDKVEQHAEANIDLKTLCNR